MAPKHMDGFVDNALKVLDSAKDIIPSVMYKECAGIIMLSAKETGFVFSAQTGAGVAVRRKSDGFSAPVAVSIEGAGAGAIFGKADKDMLIVLNPAAMDRLLAGDGQLKVGEDIGFAAGQTGAHAGMDIAGSDAGGFGTSFVYTFSKGALLSVGAESCVIQNVDKVNSEFYDTHDVKKILNGEAKPHDEALVTKLNDALKKKQ